MPILDPHFVRPISILLVALLFLGGGVFAGDAVRRRKRKTDETESKDLATILPAALTLLALLIGFSFSMAANRYDQRKALEEEEANAIGTEYVLADLVPQTAQIQALLRDYTAERILFYGETDTTRRMQINTRTSELQGKLWGSIVPVATTNQTPVVALAVKGMNDVINSQGYTQAMWWNRLPTDCWLIILIVGTFSCFLFGYSERRSGRVRMLLLPVVIALPLALIADMDTPRYGLIKVVPRNLMALQASFR